VRYKPVVPLRRFKVYPEGRWLYWNVELYSDLRDMRRAYAIKKRIVNGNTSDGSRMFGGSGATGLCLPTTWISYKTGKARTYPSLGTIMFAFPHTGAKVVSHEVSHAVSSYFQRLRISLDEVGEGERMATVVGEMVGQIIKRIW